MIYTFGDFELDTGIFELRHDGEVVHVEPQVFGVLAYLVENRERVVSKIELLDEVWPDRFVSQSALTSRIQAARKACGDTGRDQRVIRTRHGRGYRFVAEIEQVSGRPTANVQRVGGTTDARPATGAGVTQVIGREAELASLDRALVETVGGERRFVLVAGEAGFGKSTLVDAVLEGADSTAGLQTIRAQCRPHRGLAEPYVALLDGLGRFARLGDGSVVKTIERVAPMWLSQLPSLVDDDLLATLVSRTLGGTHERMLREGVNLFEEIALSAPLVLLVEDIHWADGPTLEVIEWLAGSPDVVPILVIVTYRPGESSPGDLDTTITEVSRRHESQLLTLEPLDEAAIRALALERLDETGVDDQLVSILTSHSGGNPMFVAEELDMWSREDSITTEDGMVIAAGDAHELEEQVPQNVLELIERNLDRLGDDDAAILGAAAVVGREFPAFAVADGLAIPVESTEERLGSLARHGSFVTAVGDESWPDGTVSTVFRLHHDLHQQILYGRLPASRRAAIHQAVGERLETAYAHRASEHVADLAQHFLEAGDSARAVIYLQRAGEQALARSAHADAAESLQTALEILDNAPASPERDLTEVTLRASLGPALIATLGWLPEMVEQNYARALELCAAMDAPPERFIVRWGLASVHELRGEYNRSEELLREQLDDGPGLGVETQELLACSTFHQGAYERSLDFALTALDQWDPDQHSVFMARYGEHPGVSCNTWGALSAWHLGETTLSIELADRAVEWGATNEYALATAQIQYAFLHQYRSEPERCRSWADKTIRLAEVQGFPFRVAQAHILKAWCTAAEGQPIEGADAASAGLDEYRSFGARMDEPYFLGLLADAELRAGRIEPALAHLDEAAIVIGETTRSFFSEPELDRLRASAVAGAGETDALREAANLLDRAESTARSHGAVPQVLRVLVTRAELGLDVDRPALEASVAHYSDAGPLPDVETARKLLAATEDRQ